MGCEGKRGRICGCVNLCLLWGHASRIELEASVDARGMCAATSIYMFLYAGFHYFSRAHPSAKFDLLASTIYFGYMLIMSYGIFVLCGFTGFLSCFLFIRKIYASIKID
jgi:hypothetical protein